MMAMITTTSHHQLFRGLPSDNMAANEPEPNIMAVRSMRSSRSGIVGQAKSRISLTLQAHPTSQTSECKEPALLSPFGPNMISNMDSIHSNKLDADDAVDAAAFAGASD